MPFDGTTGLYQSPYERELQIIERARAIIEMRGLAYGQLGNHGSVRCIAGALLEASGIDTYKEPHKVLPPRIEQATYYPLRKRDATSIPDFNDRYNVLRGATKEEAFAFLDDVAKELKLLAAREAAHEEAGHQEPSKLHVMEPA